MSGKREHACSCVCALHTRRCTGLAMVSSGRQETRERAFDVSLEAQLSCLNSLLHIIFYTGDISDGERELGERTPQHQQ